MAIVLLQRLLPRALGSRLLRSWLPSRTDNVSQLTMTVDMFQIVDQWHCVWPNDCLLLTIFIAWNIVI